MSVGMTPSLGSFLIAIQSQILSNLDSGCGKCYIFNGKNEIPQERYELTAQLFKRRCIGLQYIRRNHRYKHKTKPKSIGAQS
jgi:hypothetical protein